MASEVEEVLIRIRADVNQATAEIKKIQTSLGAQEKSVKSTLATWAKWAVVVGAAVSVFKRISKETIEAQKVQAQLNSVLISTNFAAGMSADAINKMASRLSDLTAIDDEVIISGQSLLLTFARIGKDVFPQATEAMLDMSVALGQDVKQSAMQVGKALNDPILGITALRRAGVQLSDDQQNQIKSFMALNDVASAQKIILEELNIEFGGSASAQLDTYGGQINALTNSMGNLAAAIGDSLHLKEGLSGLRRTIRALIEDTSVGSQWYKDYAQVYDPLESILKGADRGIRQSKKKIKLG